MPSSLFGQNPAQTNQNGVPGPLGQLKSMMGMIKGAQNPTAMMQQMLQSNPQYKQVIDYVNRNGGDPRKAFYQMAQEKGVNPNDILSMLK